MRKAIQALVAAASLMTIAAPSYAISGVPNSFYISAYGTNGVSCSFVVNGLFYYYNGYATSFCTAIDVAMQTKVTISFSATTARVITGAY